MRKMSAVRILAAVIAAIMLVTSCGCNSIIAETVQLMEQEAEETEEISWDFDSFTTKVVDKYPNGTDAFYLDGEKCLKDQIEEFHVVTHYESSFMYYYTAPSNPRYRYTGGKSGYYCLAVYDYVGKTYTVLAENFYYKNNSVSMATDSNVYGNQGCISIGDTFMFYDGIRITASYNLSEDCVDEIEDEVGDKYVCIDIALLDFIGNRVLAVYMDASEIEDDSEEEPECSVFEIIFDVSEEQDHDIYEKDDDLDSSHGNICSSFTGSLSNYDAYVYHTSDDTPSVHLEFYSPYVELRNSTRSRMECKRRGEAMLSFSATGDMLCQEVLLALLFEDRLVVWKRNETHEQGKKPKYNYENISTFPLDNSRSYAALDDMPSIVLIEGSKKLVACSLKRGCVLIGAQGSGIRTQSLKRGAYYAAYTRNYYTYTLIGFPDTNHEEIKITYQNNKEVSRQSTKVDYTMADLPYAKVYSAYYNPTL